MSAVVIDTHAIVWYFLKSRNLSATAFYLNLPLVSCDSKIQAANIQTILTHGAQKPGFLRKYFV
jgi:PIN domain nuclease of toxin-antitoxin system